MSNDLGQDVLVHTHDLTKSFAGVTAVEKLNLDIPQGAIFGFIGPSGYGKTTTVRLPLALFAFAAILFVLAWFRLGRQMAQE